jgi:hypothetical protein
MHQKEGGIPPPLQQTQQQQRLAPTFVPMANVPANTNFGGGPWRKTSMSAQLRVPYSGGGGDFGGGTMPTRKCIN